MVGKQNKLLRVLYIISLWICN